MSVFNMSRKPLLKPTLVNTKANDQQAATAILAGFMVKNKGGNRVDQDKAALLSLRYLHSGEPQDKAISKAVNDAGY
jgi:hypothetical protein